MADFLNDDRRAALARISADPARSAALPGFIYSDPQVLAAEFHNIFEASWQFIAHVSELPEPGDFLCTEIGSESLFVIRQRDGGLAAFYNVCQHRAHQLLQGRGNVKNRIVCPYHAWTYSIDGTLAAARMTKALPDFDPADFGLTPVRCTIANGFVFINLSETAPNLDDVAGGLFADMRQTLPWIEDAVAIPGSVNDSWQGGTLDANWKVLAENCLECYHCHPAHPALVDLLDMQSYRCVPHGDWFKSSGEQAATPSKAYTLDDAEPVQAASFWHMWPNTEFGLLPGEPALGCFSFLPQSPDRTRMISRIIAPPGTTVRPERADYRWNVLWPEDEALCMSVHRGLKSKGYRQGRFVIDPSNEGVSEHAVHAFQQRYIQAMGLAQ